MYPIRSDIMSNFNPRGCISLDWDRLYLLQFLPWFQSTRLYKPRRGIGAERKTSHPYFNPRGCISLDAASQGFPVPQLLFQSTRLYKPRPGATCEIWANILFQSTRLYKPRPMPQDKLGVIADFNPRGCISLDLRIMCYYTNINDFNPRGCISLDIKGCIRKCKKCLFQSTRLYKPRLIGRNTYVFRKIFQSTRLYKPRQQKHTKNLFKTLS